MALAAGTVRTATNARLVEIIGALTGFSTIPTDKQWWVTRPPGGQLKNRRCVVIGTATGTTVVDGIAASHGPSVDEWTIDCLIDITDEQDIETAEQLCEDAFNAIADLLVRDPRIGMNPGPRMVEATGSLAINSGQEHGQPAWAQAIFTIAAAADIRRNP